MTPRHEIQPEAEQFNPEGTGYGTLSSNVIRLPPEKPETNEMDERDRTLAIANAMQQYGGSFIRALAQAFVFADAANLRKLKEAFPREWNEYADLAGIEP